MRKISKRVHHFFNSQLTIDCWWWTIDSGNSNHERWRKKLVGGNLIFGSATKKNIYENIKYNYVLIRSFIFKLSIKSVLNDSSTTQLKPKHQNNNPSLLLS